MQWNSFSAFNAPYVLKAVRSHYAAPGDQLQFQASALVKGNDKRIYKPYMFLWWWKLEETQRKSTQTGEDRQTPHRESTRQGPLAVSHGAA